MTHATLLLFSPATDRPVPGSLWRVLQPRGSETFLEGYISTGIRLLSIKSGAYGATFFSKGFKILAGSSVNVNVLFSGCQTVPPEPLLLRVRSWTFQTKPRGILVQKHSACGKETDILTTTYTAGMKNCLVTSTRPVSLNPRKATP